MTKEALKTGEAAMLLPAPSEPRQDKPRTWVTPLQPALKLAIRRLKWKRSWRILESMLPLATSFAAAWIAVARYTLLEVPQWPVALAIALPIVLLAVGTWRGGIGIMSAARYLDRALSLDERVATAVELARRPLDQTDTVTEPLHRRLVEDALHELEIRLSALPTPFAVRLRLGHSFFTAASVLALALALMLPSPVDAVRVERALLRAAVQNELQRIADLRVQIVARPDLPQHIQTSILSELDRLEERLLKSATDRSELLAALADTEESLRTLSPATPADFTGLSTAAKLIQVAADNTPGRVGNELEPSPDLGDASSALRYLAQTLSSLSDADARAVGQSLRAAALQISASNPEISSSLSKAVAALDAGDRANAAQDLLQAANQFGAAQQSQQIAQTVDQTLSKLDEGRQSIATAGRSAVKKPQVGFRVGPSLQPPVGSANTPTGGVASQAQDSNNPVQNSTSPSDPNGVRIGSNVPAFGGPASSGSQSSSGQQAPGQSVGGAPSVPGQPSQASGTPAAQSGAAATLQGPITGPPSGSTGAISQVPNPSGVGTGTTGTSAGGAPGGSTQEGIYAPQPAAASTQNGAASTGQVVPPSGLGAASSGGTVGGTGDGSAGRGSGSLTTVRTPYKQVVRDYAQRANEALDKTYIPDDAKEYVKQYFTELNR
jgi:hypothetical protein